MKRFNIGLATAAILAFGSLAYISGAKDRIQPEHHMQSQFSIINDYARYHDAGSAGFKSVVDNQVKYFNEKLKDSFSFDAKQTDESLTFTVNFVAPDNYACNSAEWWEGVALTAIEKNQFTYGGSLAVEYKDGVEATYVESNDDGKSFERFTSFMCKDGKSNVNKIAISNTFIQQYPKNK